jgi:hypothetical protein
MADSKKPYAPSTLCQKNGGCMGCCGNNFESKKAIRNAIHKNTLDHKYFGIKEEEDNVSFRERVGSSNLRKGVCRNLISVTKKDGSEQILCPLHPTKHAGKDLRTGHCNIYYLCKTAKEFSEWDKEMQEMFLDFLREKKLDNIDYSMLMADDSLLSEFYLRFKKEDV